MRRSLMVLCVGSLIACGGATAPHALSPAAVNGTWQFTLTRDHACSGVASPTTGYVTFDFQGSPGNTVSHWTFNASAPDQFDLTGSVQWKTGATSLSFWNGELVAGFEVDGTIAADGTLTGTATDPIPGYQPELSLDGCVYDVTAHKVS